MQIINNNEPYLTEIQIPEEGILLPEFFNLLNNEVLKSGVIIISIMLNDEILNISKLNREQIIKSTDTLEIITDTPSNITKKSLKDIEEQIDEFIPEIDDIISDLIKGDKVSSFNKFNSLLEKFKDITQLLKTIELLFQIDFSQISSNGKTINEYIDSLLKILSEIKDSMMNDDMVTLTDLLEYEIKDIFTVELKQVLQSLSKVL